VDKYTILQVIEKERLRQGMSKRELAKKAGVTDRSLYMWESDQRGMTLTNADSLLKAVGMTLVIDIERKERRNRHGKEDNTESGG
jgi:transcriptional regulator with XRE-family HTH domain